MKKHFILPVGILLLSLFTSFAFAAEIPPGGFDYTNDKHGFYLVMPDGWQTIEIIEENFDGDTVFTFSLETTDTSGDYPDGKVDMFKIIATEVAGMEMAEYLGENSVYTFYFTHLNGFPPDDLMEQVLDFDQITSTFVASEPVAVPELFSGFSDTAGHKYEAAIDFVKSEGVVEGYADGTYRPDSPVNRAEFTKILMEALYESSSIVGSDCFPDVGTEWFAKYVCSAQGLGVVGGYPDGTFGPAKNINLVESLKIILEFSAALNDETITPVEGEWYQVYLDYANAANLLDTIDSDPAHFLTRGEMAEIMYQMAMRVEE